MTGSSGAVHDAILDLLQARGVPFHHLEHEPTRTSADSARARGEDLGIGGKALLLQFEGKFALFVMSAARRLHSSRIRKHLGVKRLRFATPQELDELTGLVPGSVPPFGPPILPFALHADPSVLENDRIAFNAGSLSHSIIMSSADWRAIADPTVFPFTRPGEPQSDSPDSRR